MSTTSISSPQPGETSLGPAEKQGMAEGVWGPSTGQPELVTDVQNMKGVSKESLCSCG